MKVINASGDGFNGTDGVSSDGTHVWVPNSNGNSVTELNAVPFANRSSSPELQALLDLARAL